MVYFQPSWRCFSLTLLCFDPACYCIALLIKSHTDLPLMNFAFAPLHWIAHHILFQVKWRSDECLSVKLTPEPSRSWQVSMAGSRSLPPSQWKQRRISENHLPLWVPACVQTLTLSEYISSTDTQSRGVGNTAIETTAEGQRLLWHCIRDLWPLQSNNSSMFYDN